MSEQTKTDEPVKQEGDFKLTPKKKLPKKLGNINNDPIKVDLTKPEATGEIVPDVTKVTIPKEKDAISEQKTGGLLEDQRAGDIQKVDEQVRPSESVEVQEPKQEDSVVEIEEITQEQEQEVKEIKQEIAEAQRDEQVLGKALPENIDKLVTFMEDTGGTVEDYVRLNADYSNIDDQVLLKEYYKNIKPHLNEEEIDFVLTDQFSHSEDEEENIIRKKQLAMKEEIAKAKNFLEETKSKYYEEIKLRPGVTQDQQKAMDFFNRYNKEQDAVKQRHQDFKSRTNKYFTNDFKGFDFDVSDKKFRYGINNPDNVAETQSDLNNFVKKFLDEKGNIHDVHGYHKAIYAARNADTLAEHFYEQGKADAMKSSIEKSKNVDMDPRGTHEKVTTANGWQIRAVPNNSVSGSKLKIKKR